jgi:hypothetical protein
MTDSTATSSTRVNQMIPSTVSVTFRCPSDEAEENAITLFNSIFGEGGWILAKKGNEPLPVQLVGKAIHSYTFTAWKS